MIKVFIFHGFEGSPNGGWRPWLMGELEKKDIYACALPMPNPENPLLEEWVQTVHDVFQNNQNDKLILIGHSLGGTAILRYLEKYTPKNVYGVYLVSTPCHETQNLKITSFLNKKFDWVFIKDKLKSSVVIHGDNDPYVPISDAEEIKKELESDFIVIKNGKHLNGSAGYLELPELLQSLDSQIKNL